MKTRLNNNPKVSVLRLIASCLVVFIHITFVGDLGKAMSCLARFAVPCFFAISGYYSNRIQASSIRKRILKALYLLLMGSFVYFLWDVIYNHFFVGNGLNAYFAKLLTIKTLARFIFLCENPFSDHLWYLLAIVIVYFLYMLYLTFANENKSFYVIGVCAFFFQIMFGLKMIGADHKFSYTLYRNTLFFGIPMFALGLFIREKESALFRISNKKWVGIIALGVAASLLQWFGIGKVEMPIGAIAIVIGVLTIAFRPDNSFKSFDRWSGLFEKMSIIIYIIHPLISKVIRTLKGWAKYADMDPSFRAIYPLVILALSLIISFCIVWIEFFIAKAFKKVCGTKTQ